MSIEDLKKKFIVDDDVLKNRLEEIATKALQLCVLDKKEMFTLTTGSSRLGKSFASR